jgi:acetyltransferase-like isoleucine patch superfamily enzyme
VWKVFLKFPSAWARLKTVCFYRLFFGSIGRKSTIRKPLLITNPDCIHIGDGVVIRDGVRLEVVKDGENETPVLRIGSYTNIEQNVHIACHSQILIGQFVSITANCAVVDITHPYLDVQDTSSYSSRIDPRPSYVEIGDYCFVGIGTVILPNVRIGHHSIIGANSVVTRDVPSYSVAHGNPARIIKRYDPLSELWTSA